MADTSQYTDSVGSINSEHSVTWQGIGALAAALVRKAGAA